MVDHVWPEDTGTGASDGDYLDAANFAAGAHHPNATDYVAYGSGITADFTNGVYDVASGGFFASDSSASTVNTGETRTNVTYAAEADGRTGIAMADTAGMNYVFYDIDLTTDDSITVVTKTSDSAPADPSLKIGEIDAANNTVTEVNRAPDGAFETFTADDASLTAGSVDSAPSSSTDVVRKTDIDGTLTPTVLHNVDYASEYTDLTSATAAAYNNGRGWVYLPPGTYDDGGTALNMKRGVKYRGNQNGVYTSDSRNATITCDVQVGSNHTSYSMGWEFVTFYQNSVDFSTGTSVVNHFITNCGMRGGGTSITMSARRGEIRGIRSYTGGTAHSITLGADAQGCTVKGIRTNDMNITVNSAASGNTIGDFTSTGPSTVQINGDQNTLSNVQINDTNGAINIDGNQNTMIGHPGSATVTLNGSNNTLVGVPSGSVTDNGSGNTVL